MVLNITNESENRMMEEDDVSVRVAVRIRPRIPREVIDMCQVCTAVTPGEPQVTLGSDKSFTYDYVFDVDATQEEVYNTCVDSLVNSTLEGYNSTVLAYGQTGSGKTYTMGSGFDVEIKSEQQGIISRAIENLFAGIDTRVATAQREGKLVPEFKVTSQFMELYNEDIIDLFDPSLNKQKSYKIHEEAATGIYVKGITQSTVTSAAEALQCLRVGALSRTTASTQMNTQSSRSHAIFTLNIRQQRLVPSEEFDSKDLETLTAKFHFVDLAGSERLKRTGATGERAKEGISINCGLLALGNVISALGDKSKKALHVPYRDSKLTRLLQDSLGGNSQTVMIACISPSDRDFMETLNTLKYANRARNIKNKVFINQDKTCRTLAHLRQQISQLQIELAEYKQGKRIIGKDGLETVNDMFYENNMLQGEINNLRTRVKAMQGTIDSLISKNAELITAKEIDNLGEKSSNIQVSDFIQNYIKEIEDLRAKLVEANQTNDLLRKQLSKAQSTSTKGLEISFSEKSLLEEAKKKLTEEKKVLEKNRLSHEFENESSENSEAETESDSEDLAKELKDELITLTNDIDMKQKLIDELELSQRRMQTMRQHYEDKLMQLQMRIRDTQEERDKMLHSYSAHSEESDKVKKIKDEFTRKLTDMQRELKRLQAAQKEHSRLLRNQNQHETQLKSYKNELIEMKRIKVKLMNKMRDESQRHKQAELIKNREIAQLRKESRKTANVIKTMETERRIKDQVLKRKQEEVSLLRRNQKSMISGRSNSSLHDKNFSLKLAKQKWLKMEKSINNITFNKKGLVEQEVRMEHFLEKRQELGKELDVLQERREGAVEKDQDITQLDSYIEDIKENINYVQETISETQRNVMEIEDTQDNNETLNVKQIIDTLYNIDEAKYLIEKLLSMTLNQSHVAFQRDAKLKENEATLAELKQDNLVKGQLLDHVLHNELPIFSKGNTLSDNNDTASSNNTSRSTSPTELLNAKDAQFQGSKLKIRRRTAAPNEMLFGTDATPDVIRHSNVALENVLHRTPSFPGNLKLNW